MPRTYALLSPCVCARVERLQRDAVADASFTLDDNGSAFRADCCTHMWCHPCAMAQEIRHIRDVRAAAIAPPAPGGTLDAAPKAEKMALIDWQPVESKDKVASLTKAYL